MDVTFWGSIAVLVIAGLTVFVLNATKGVSRSYEDLKRPLQDLLSRGLENATLIIDHKRSHRFVQFKKYTRSREQSGIELFFPKAEWSREYFERLQNYCQIEGFSTRSVFGDDENRMEFLCIDLNGDVEKAHAVLGNVLQKIFGLSPKEKYYVLLQNAKPH